MKEAMKIANSSWNHQSFEIRKIMSQSVASDSIVILLNEKKELKNYYQKACKRIDDKIDLLINVVEIGYAESEKGEAINTSSNSMSSSLSSDIDSNSISEEKKDIKAHFIRSYELKLKEITGNDVKAPWAGKEAKLLCQNLETHGKETIMKYIDIFFSDRDKTIADFTRYKNMAGYSFGVFHGMIPKLALSKVKQNPICLGCGYTIGHSLDCPEIEKNRKKRIAEDNEINRSRDENKDYSFTDAFINRIKEGE